jgi:hypothetical protein
MSKQHHRQTEMEQGKQGDDSVYLVGGRPLADRSSWKRLVSLGGTGKAAFIATGAALTQMIGGHPLPVVGWCGAFTGILIYDAGKQLIDERRKAKNPGA